MSSHMTTFIAVKAGTTGESAEKVRVIARHVLVPTTFIAVKAGMTGESAEKVRVIPRHVSVPTTFIAVKAGTTGESAEKVRAIIPGHVLVSMTFIVITPMLNPMTYCSITSGQYISIIYPKAII